MATNNTNMNNETSRMEEDRQFACHELGMRLWNKLMESPPDIDVHIVLSKLLYGLPPESRKRIHIALGEHVVFMHEKAENEERNLSN